MIDANQMQVRIPLEGKAGDIRGCVRIHTLFGKSGGNFESYGNNFERGHTYKFGIEAVNLGVPRQIEDQS